MHCALCTSPVPRNDHVHFVDFGGNGSSDAHWKCLRLAGRTYQIDPNQSIAVMAEDNRLLRELRKR